MQLQSYPYQWLMLIWWRLEREAHKKRSHVKEMLAAEKNTLSFSHSGDPQELMCGNAYLLTWKFCRKEQRERDWQLCVLLSKISLALELCGSSCKEKLLLALASLATGFLTSTLINILITQLPLSTSLSHNCPYLNAQYACWLQSGLVSIWKLYIKNALHALHAFCHLLIHTLCFLDLGIPLAQPRATLWPWYLTLGTFELISRSGLYQFN